MPVQRANNYAQLALHALTELPFVLLRLALELEMMDSVAEAVDVAVTKVGYEVVVIHRVGLEGTTRRNVNAADDLVDPDFA